MKNKQKKSAKYFLDIVIDLIDHAASNIAFKEEYP